MTAPPVAQSSIRAQDSERDALLPHPEGPKPFFAKCTWTASPSWLFPVILVVSMSRGVTMSPQIQVYNAIACRALSQGENFQSSSISIGMEADCLGPDVQARAAHIQAAVTTLTHILSAISTGFWGRFGDSFGRKPTLFIFLSGAIAMEFAHVLAMDAESVFGRSAEWWILIGPILEGLMGGLPLYHGVTHAYISDCTLHGSRSKVFSLMQGIVYAGLAMGPWAGGLVLHEPATSPVEEAFYVGIALLVASMIYVIFILPESRSRVCHEEVMTPEDGQPARLESFVRPHHTHHKRAKNSLAHILRYALRHFVSVLVLPISMFSPRAIPGELRKKNYNLTLAGASLFVLVVSGAIGAVKYLYALHTYNWTTAQLGYYMSFLWIVRAFNLLILLPSLISYFKPKSPPEDGAASIPEKIAAEMLFDVRLAQYSVGLDFVGDLLITLLPTSSQFSFVAISSLSAFASGGNPTLHSLSAVCLYASGAGSQTGTLFGAIAVLTALSHIISPFISAVTYSSTVATFPKAIFLLGVAELAIVFLLLSRIDARPENVHPSQIGDSNGTFRSESDHVSSESDASV